MGVPSSGALEVTGRDGGPAGAESARELTDERASIRKPDRLATGSANGRIANAARRGPLTNVRFQASARPPAGVIGEKASSATADLSPRDTRVSGSVTTK